jgi:hypothetical protein
MDISMFPRLVKQIRAREFPTVSGQVTRSEVIIASRSKGQKSYREAIHYAYVVDGHEYTSERPNLGGIRIGSGRRQAEALVAQYPVGKELTVFYDPAAPGDSVLRPGLLPEHLLTALMIVPFHLIAFGLMYLTVYPLVARVVSSTPPLRPLDDLRMVVRMPWLEPWAVGLITLAAASIASLFIAPFLLPQPLSMAAVLVVWIIVGGVTLFTALRRRTQLRAGVADLTIDAGARTVTLPLGCGRKERVTLPFSDIRGVRVRQLPASTTHTTSRGWRVTKTNNSPPYELALIGPSEQPFALVTSAMPEKLRAIADALTGTFGWPLIPGV